MRPIPIQDPVMTFLQLLQALEQRLGHVHLPVRPQAAGLPDVFEGCGLHHELAVTLVRAIYTENRCRHVRDWVSAEACLRAVAPIHAAVAHADHTDIDTYRFSEGFLAAVQAVFEHKPRSRPPKSPEPRGQILSFPLARRRAHH
ncbi:hypothetical protein [Acidiferrobacter thiooxydans]|nr:hypothetical protein [Acidiferrobacter thiooxydans]MDA8190360.1 hypothetical protein [Gammaproteobacteria bacterium]UEN98647.1 hypothetical protein A9R16_009405 [Acidiferrobacter thiooxydans]